MFSFCKGNESVFRLTKGEIKILRVGLFFYFGIKGTRCDLRGTIYEL